MENRNERELRALVVSESEEAIDSNLAITMSPPFSQTRERGRCTNDSSSDSPIQKLTNELLVEILVRLPSSKSASLCKAVCKRWLALIDSDPLFITTFLRRRRREAGGEIWLPFRLYSLRVHTSLHERASFGASHFSLNFLPYEDPDQIWILATFNDLVLCCPNLYDYSVFYLCNPVTKHWLVLPPPPCHETARVNGRIRVGFVCENYCNFDDDRVVVNRGFRFKLVCIPRVVVRENCEVEIFSSETNQWSKSVLELPPQSSDSTVVFNTVAYNGMLHYVGASKGYMNIIGFSPLGDGGVINCHYIQRPSVAPEIKMGCIGVCRGRLRACSLHLPINVETDSCAFGFSVWELEDYTTSEWTLLHSLCFNQFGAEQPFLHRFESHYYNFHHLEAQTFNPFDEDIIYFQFCRNVVSCNMRTRRLEVVHRLSREAPQYDGVYPLVLPWWPTPLPALPE